MSGVDDRAGAVDDVASVPKEVELPVAPVLVRDYQRLLRLFPYTYRRDHEAEMLGHLLDGAAPGQARPSRAERWDLLRAAVREWLFAPLGSTARQRRDGSALLFVSLAVILAVQAARELSAAVAFLSSASRHEALGIAGEPLWIGVDVLISVPLAPAWLAWAICAVALAVGLSRTGTVLAVLATVAGAVAVGGLISAERAHLGYVSAGWVVGLLAFALVVADRSRLPGRVVTIQMAAAAVWCTALAVVVSVLSTSADRASLGAPWWSSAHDLSWTFSGAPVLLAVPLGAAALWSRTRQAVPLLAGFAVAWSLGRSQMLWSGNLQPETVDLGNVLAGFGLPIAATAAARWVVNRLDELQDARASHRALLAATGGVADPRERRPGEPTAV